MGANRHRSIPGSLVSQNVPALSRQEENKGAWKDSRRGALLASVLVTVQVFLRSGLKPNSTGGQIWKYRGCSAVDQPLLSTRGSVYTSSNRIVLKRSGSDSWAGFPTCWEPSSSAFAYPSTITYESCLTTRYPTIADTSSSLLPNESSPSRCQIRLVGWSSDQTTFGVQARRLQNLGGGINGMERPSTWTQTPFVLEVRLIALADPKVGTLNKPFV